MELTNEQKVAIETAVQTAFQNKRVLIGKFLWESPEKIIKPLLLELGYHYRGWDWLDGKGWRLKAAYDTTGSKGWGFEVDGNGNCSNFDWDIEIANPD